MDDRQLFSEPVVLAVTELFGPEQARLHTFVVMASLQSPPWLRLGRWFSRRVAHNERLGANWKTRRAFWADRASNESALRTNLLSLAATRARHLGQGDIQSDLFYDYRTNVEAYPKWQAWMREKQPRLLVIWGKYELSFDPGEPERYPRDAPNAGIHIVDGGHFALDTAADQIAALVQGFLGFSREADVRRAG